MIVLSVKLILALSCISAFCLGTGVADTCPASASVQCIPGLPGRDGQPGPPGPSGLNGHNGRDGATGAPGPQGPPGLNGTNGQQGLPGPQGPQGPMGEQGMKGNRGEPGPSGSDGRDGVDGAPGRNGTDGLPGPPGTLTDAVIQQLRKDILEDVWKRFLCKGITNTNPATSCKEIHQCNPAAPSGFYWVSTTTGVGQVFCSSGGISDCYDAMMQGANESGVYAIHPINASNSVNVYCDMETDGGGWTVLLKRQDGSVDFYLNWADYKRGFGNLEGEYWLGLDNMYLLTNLSSDPPQLRVDLADWEGNTAFAKYGQFSVGDEDSDYTLSVLGYQNDSTAGDSLTHNDGYGPHNGQRFSTPDRDRDRTLLRHCAEYYHAPWWHNTCYDSILTGKYFTSPSRSSPPLGIIWHSWKGRNYSLRVAEMKIRPGGV